MPDWLAGRRVAIIPPAIDAFSLKNAHLEAPCRQAVLERLGLLAASAPAEGALEFRRADGSRCRLVRRAEVLQAAPVPGPQVPLVVQVSRWDPLKDMAGVMRGFAAALARLNGAHLVLAGPEVRGVSDDPEGARVLAECTEAWHRLPPSARERVHLLCLPMQDVDENAVMVNALQSHASVVVQKSLREGFGLTVTEAMWKGRAVLASAVGGIREQIVNGVHGLLLEQPAETGPFAEALAQLLRDRALARRLGRNARRRAQSRFLAPRQLVQFIELIAELPGIARG